MKKIAGYILSYICFFLGDISSKISHIKINDRTIFDNTLFGYWLAKLYQWFMWRSDQLQTWGGCGPWFETFICQRNEEFKDRCKKQCEHCEQYYKHIK
jgi:hypothetical protein